MFEFESRKTLKSRIEYLTDELEESEESARQYRECWHSELERVERLQKEMANKEVEHRAKLDAAMQMINSQNKNLSEWMQVKRENIALRQILEDVTGKSADDLLEAHARAIRLLEYDVEAFSGREEN